MANINSQLKTDRNSSDLGSTIIRLGGWNLRKRPIGDKRLFISKTYSCSISLSSLIWYQEGFNFSVEWWYYQNETWSDPSSKVIWRLERKLSENIPLWSFLSARISNLHVSKYIEDPILQSICWDYFFCKSCEHKNGVSSRKRGMWGTGLWGGRIIRDVGLASLTWQFWRCQSKKSIWIIIMCEAQPPLSSMCYYYM